jgi:hypothetical protein
MPDDDQIRKNRLERRAMMGVDTVVASLPIISQAILALAATLDKDAFPHIDASLTEARFYPLQIILLCVVISGHAAVDWIGAMRSARDATRPSLALFLLLTFVFFILSIMFAVTMLDKEIVLSWLVVTCIFGLVDLILAYLLEMELATL